MTLAAGNPRRRGFFLVEALIAIAIISGSFLAMAQAMSSLRIANRREETARLTAQCAENCLAMTLRGRNTPRIPCDAAVRVEQGSGLVGGDIEETRWRLSIGNSTPEIFTVIRYAG